MEEALESIKECIYTSRINITSCSRRARIPQNLSHSTIFRAEPEWQTEPELSSSLAQAPSAQCLTLQGLGVEKTFIQFAEEEDSLLRNVSLFKSLVSAPSEKFLGKHQAALRKFTLRYPTWKM